MQQAWNASHDLNSMDDWLTEDTGSNGADNEMLIAHEAPDPIVKNVDADNLPEGYVLIVGDDGEVSWSMLELDCDGDIYSANVTCLDVTHYIDEASLLNLFESQLEKGLES